MSTVMESTLLRASNRWPGLVEFALEEGRRAIELLPVAKDALNGQMTKLLVQATSEM